MWKQSFLNLSVLKANSHDLALPFAPLPVMLSLRSIPGEAADGRLSAQCERALRVEILRSGSE